MDNKELEAIKVILDKHGYRVTVEGTPDGCIATFPKYIEEPEQDSLVLQYIFNVEGIRIILFDEDGQETLNLQQPCPIYAQQLMILSDIVVRSLKMNFTIALAKFVLGGVEESEEVFYEKWINPLCSPEDIELGKKLKPVIITCIFSSFNTLAEIYAKHNNILEGYKAIKNFMIPDEKQNEEKDSVDG